MSDAVYTPGIPVYGGPEAAATNSVHIDSTQRMLDRNEPANEISDVEMRDRDVNRRTGAPPRRTAGLPVGGRPENKCTGGSPICTRLNVGDSYSETHVQYSYLYLSTDGACAV